MRIPPSLDFRVNQEYLYINSTITWPLRPSGLPSARAEQVHRREVYQERDNSKLATRHALSRSSFSIAYVSRIYALRCGDLLPAKRDRHRANVNAYYYATAMGLPFFLAFSPVSRPFFITLSVFAFENHRFPSRGCLPAAVVNLPLPTGSIRHIVTIGHVMIKVPPIFKREKKSCQRQLHYRTRTLS